MIINKRGISAERFVNLVNFLHSPPNQVMVRGRDNKDLQVSVATLQSVMISLVRDRDCMPLGATYDVSIVVIDKYHPATGDGWSESRVISTERQYIDSILEILHPSRD